MDCSGLMENAPSNCFQFAPPATGSCEGQILCAAWGPPADSGVGGEVPDPALVEGNGVKTPIQALGRWQRVAWLQKKITNQNARSGKRKKRKNGSVTIYDTTMHGKLKTDAWCSAG